MRLLAGMTTLGFVAWGAAALYFASTTDTCAGGGGGRFVCQDWVDLAAGIVFVAAILGIVVLALVGIARLVRSFASRFARPS